MTGDSASPDSHGESDANGNLFVYGTLLLPAVIETLIDRIPSWLPQRCTAIAATD